MSLCLLASVATAATHVTATYDLGANPQVMATVGGQPQYGLVFAQRNKTVTYNSVEYGPGVVKGYLDSNGALNDGAGNLWLDLIPNLGATPADSYYVVTFNIQGTVHAEIWIVPDVASVDAETIRQTQPPGATGGGFDLNNATGLLGLAHGGTGQSSWSAARCVRVNDAGNALESAPADCGTGGGSAPKASSTVSGTVKTDATETDPVVYLKTTSDTLLAGKASSVHTHSENDVTNLVTDLAGKVPATRSVGASAPLAGGGTLDADLTLSCPTCEVTGNKNAASGYAGLTAGTKLNAAQGQEVWSVTDLSDYNATSGSGTTAIKGTITSPADAQCLVWSAAGSNWVNSSCAGGSSNHNLLSATHPDTVSAAPVLGDILFANSTPAWTRLAGNTTTSKRFLTQTGTGAVSAAPAWGPIAAGDVPDLSSTYQATSGKNAANGYAGLTAGTKLNAAQGQEVWAVADLTDFTGTSGSGSTAIKSTVTTPADNDFLKYSSGNWVNASPHAGTNLTADLEEEGQINATAVTGNAADDQVLLGSGPSALAYATIPDCHTENMLTYTQSTNTWGCEADSTGGAGGGYDAVSGDTGAASKTASEGLQVKGTANQLTSAAADGAPDTITFALANPLTLPGAVNAAADAKFNSLTLDNTNGDIRLSRYSDGFYGLAALLRSPMTNENSSLLISPNGIGSGSAVARLTVSLTDYDNSNDEFFTFVARTDDNAFWLSSETTGTGTLRPIKVRFNSTTAATFNTDGTTSFGGNISAPVMGATTGLRVNGVAASGQVLRGNGTNFVSSPDTREILIRIGSDTGATLVDGDDEATAFRNSIAPMTITEVWCESDAGTPVINLGRDDGTPANILSSNLTCSTSGATGTIDTNEDNLAVGDKIDFTMVTAGGTAKRVTVAIKAVID